MNKLRRLTTGFLGICAVFFVTTTLASSGEEVFRKEREPAYQPAYLDHYYARPSIYHSLTIYNYFGLALGSGSGNFKYSETLAGQTIAKDLTADFSSQFFGTLFYGFGDTYHNFYYGLEAQFLANSVKADSISHVTTPVFTTQFKMPYILAVDFLPGFLVTDKLLGFFRLGALGGYLEAKFDQLPMSKLKFHEIVPGLRIGFGVDFYFTNNFSIRGDYFFTNYFSVSKEIKDPTLGIDYKADISARTNQFNLGVAYHF